MRFLYCVVITAAVCPSPKQDTVGSSTLHTTNCCTYPTDADRAELVIFCVDDVCAAEALVPRLLPFGHQRTVDQFLGNGTDIRREGT